MLTGHPFYVRSWDYWGISVFLILSVQIHEGLLGVFNNNFELKLHKEKKGSDSNLLALDLSIDDNRVTMINIYGPNTDCPDFFEKVRECFLDFDNDYLFFVVILI